MPVFILYQVLYDWPNVVKAVGFRNINCISALCTICQTNFKKMAGFTPFTSKISRTKGAARWVMCE